MTNNYFTEKFIIPEIFKSIEKAFIERIVSGDSKRERILKKEGLLKILSPGRINIIGEHTDYNLGLSLPFAIDKYKFFTGMKNHTEKVEIYDMSFKQYYSFSLDKIVYDEVTGWPNYIKGIISEYLADGNNISGFSIVIDSNLPSGSGVSSSAAILAGVALIIEKLFTLKNPREKMLQYCHDAENDFIRVNSGFLDHFAVIYGKKNNAIFLNFKDLSFDYVPLKLGEYVFLIIDSKEERFLPATDYNKRREECNLALEKISQISNRIFKSLSEIDSDLLQKLEGKLPANLFKRVRHIVNENNRVLKAKEYLKKGELESLGMLIKGSHESLRDDYEISTEKIDFLVNESITAGDVLGARVMGGGFGGSVIVLVRNSVVQTLTDKVAKSYYAKFKMIPNFLVCNSSHGVKTF